MATPMEYDTLREIFSSAGAALHRLKVTYGVAVQFHHVVEKEVKGECDSLRHLRVKGKRDETKLSQQCEE